MGGLWIVVCLLPVAVNGLKKKCDEIDDKLVLTNDSNICDPAGKVLGNPLKAVTLDFSKAENRTLNEFLGKFKQIFGAIVIDGNRRVETVNLANITSWNGSPLSPNVTFISIRNNPKLKRFLWNSSQNLRIATNNQELYVLVYNNPLLDGNATRMINDTIARSNRTNIKSYIQSGPHECRFQDPFEPKNYTTPSAKLLAGCKVIKGDFIMEGGRLAVDNLTLDENACLKLVDVSMIEVRHILAPAGKGLAICGNGTKSEVVNNDNLCWSEFSAVEEYFPRELNVTVRKDGSCSSGGGSGDPDDPCGGGGCRDGWMEPIARLPSEDKKRFRIPWILISVVSCLAVAAVIGTVVNCCYCWTDSHYSATPQKTRRSTKPGTVKSQTAASYKPLSTSTTTTTTTTPDNPV